MVVNNNLCTGLKDLNGNSILLGDTIKYKNMFAKVELIANRFGARFGFRLDDKVCFLGILHNSVEVCRE